MKVDNESRNLSDFNTSVRVGADMESCEFEHRSFHQAEHQRFWACIENDKKSTCKTPLTIP